MKTGIWPRRIPQRGMLVLALLWPLSLHALDTPLESPESWKNLRRLGGVGPATERIIKEILDTGTSRTYERILRGGNPSG